MNKKEADETIEFWKNYRNYDGIESYAEAKCFLEGYTEAEKKYENEIARGDNIIGNLRKALERQEAKAVILVKALEYEVKQGALHGCRCRTAEKALQKYKEQV